MTWDDVINRKEGSADVYHAETTYAYTALSTGGGVTAGAFLGGVSTYSETVNYKIGHLGGRDNSPHDTSITTTFQWWDGAVQSHITYDRNIYQGGTVLWTTDFAYDLGGKMTWADIDDGRDREVFFVNDANGQVMKRWEVSSLDDPIDNYFTFNGRRIGETSNNGATDRDYATMIAARDDDPPSGTTAAFRYGQVTPHADFDQSYNVINAGTPGAQPSSYTVEQGDSLRSIAQAVWGDGALWYIIAEANGLTAASELAAGITLTIPAHVANVHNTSETFRPYDPNKAMGNVSPTQPKPNKKPEGCGLKQFIVAVIAVVVTVIVYKFLGPQIAKQVGQWMMKLGVSGTAPGAAAATAHVAATTTGTTAAVAAAGSPAAIAGIAAAGAVAGAAGSIVSQGVGLAIGAQDKFSWNAVALAAIGGAVGKTLPFSPLGKIEGLAGGAIRGGVSSVITQSIGVATGLQKQFSWANVAVSAIAGGVSEYLRIHWDAPEQLPAAVFRDAAIGLAGGVAGAATRSLIEGSDFGDNLVSALPDILANTIGGMIVGEIEVGRSTARLEQKAASDDAKYDNLGDGIEVVSAAERALARAAEDQAIDKTLIAAGVGSLPEGTRVSDLKGPKIVVDMFSVGIRSDGTGFQATSQQVLGEDGMESVGKADGTGLLITALEGRSAEGKVFTIDWVAAELGKAPIGVISENGGPIYLLDGRSVYRELGIKLAWTQDTYDYSGEAARDEAAEKARQAEAFRAEKARYDVAYRQAGEDMRRDLPRMYWMVARDVLPVISDYRAGKEFLARPGWGTGAAFAAGVIPLGGDLVSAAIRHAPVKEASRLLEGASDLGRAPGVDLAARAAPEEVVAQAARTGDRAAAGRSPEELLALAARGGGGAAAARIPPDEAVALVAKGGDEVLAAESAAPRIGPRLLPTEGNVGTYRDLIRVGSKGDDITPNHIPSANRMAQEGVSRGDGIAINMEQPVPGVGGRHRSTFTYGTQADINMTPRGALAAGVWDARGIYRADGLYGPQIRGNLQDLIRMNKTQHPTIFRKPGQ